MAKIDKDRYADVRRCRYWALTWRVIGRLPGDTEAYRSSSDDHVTTMVNRMVNRSLNYV
ncbi:hypothetical protein AB6D20_028100 (plasmid) [Vibrio splendidus]